MSDLLLDLLELAAHGVLGPLGSALRSFFGYKPSENFDNETYSIANILIGALVLVGGIFLIAFAILYCASKIKNF